MFRVDDGLITFATATVPGSDSTPAAVTGGAGAYGDGTATHTLTLLP